MRSQIRTISAAFFCLLQCVTCACAHNGQHYQAQPVSEISIDGDLSDWPAGLTEYPIATPYLGDGTADTDDFTGHFRIGCDYAENALYVAVEVQDDDVIVDPAEAPFWCTHDICEIFLVLDHRGESVIPFQFVYRATPLAAIEDTPSQELAEAMEVVRVAQNGRLVFEWKIDISKLRDGNGQLSSGALFGFDVGYIDRDTPNRVKAFSSSTGSSKHLDSRQHGDLLIPPSSGQLAKLSGQTAWNVPRATPPGKIVIQSKTDSTLYLEAPVALDGSFTFSLPHGDYTICASDDRTLVESEPIDLSLQQDTQLPSPVRLKFRGSLDELINRHLEAYNIPATAVAVIEDGQVTYAKVIGQQHTGRPATDNTIFKVASITKPVAATLAMKLTAQGVWDIDEPLVNHWQDPNVEDSPYLNRITSRMSLQHRTGFPNWRPHSQLEFEHIPGDAWQYSGEGYEYMRRAIESKTGKRFDQLASDLLFEPLQMRDTYWVWDETTEDTLSVRYAGEHNSVGKQGYFHRPSQPNAAANLFTTANDYAKFLIATIDGTILPATLHDEMLRPHFSVPDRQNEFMGIGWFLLEGEDKADRIAFHGGSQRGIRTLAAFAPQQRDGVVVLTNGENGNHVIRAVVAHSLNRDNQYPHLEKALHHH